MLSEALSLEKTVILGGSGLMVVITVMINEVNGVAGIVGALHQ